MPPTTSQKKQEMYMLCNNGTCSDLRNPKPFLHLIQRPHFY